MIDGKLVRTLLLTQDEARFGCSGGIKHGFAVLRLGDVSIDRGEELALACHLGPNLYDVGTAHDVVRCALRDVPAPYLNAGGFPNLYGAIDYLRAQTGEPSIDAGTEVTCVYWRGEGFKDAAPLPQLRGHGTAREQDLELFKRKRTPFTGRVSSYPKPSGRVVTPCGFDFNMPPQLLPFAGGGPVDYAKIAKVVRSVFGQ